ncbi:Pr6Pr family membrane protein [Kineococcus gynurae]|uniref:Pr6Pr family membrane protein n=1 Tax=Kineococcus gynurae TaxID=452979 RepID=A0ABV5LRP2_9ACTN
MRTAALSRVWHTVLALVVAATLATQLVIDVRGGSGAGSLGTRLAETFSYFTVQSNALVLLTAVSLALDPRRDGRFWRILRLDAMLGITVTALVYGTVLAGSVQRAGIDWWVDAGFHDVSPAMALAGFLLFGPRPRIDGRTVAWAFAWPLGWIAYTFVRGEAVGWYPYPFLDVAEIGLGASLRNTGVVVVLSVLLLLGFRWADRRLPGRDASPPPR